MTLAFSGMTFRDGFCEQLLHRSQHESVQWIAVPPGHSQETAVDALLETSRDGFFSPLRTLTLEVDSPERLKSSLLQELADELILDAPLTDSIEDFILQNTDALRMPYSFLLPLPPQTKPSTLQALLKMCEKLAEFSKDLEGPLSFLLLTQPPLPPHIEGNMAWVWEPLQPQPSFLQFSRTGVSLEALGFQIYLAYRCYWEAGGRPDLLQRLQEGVGGTDLSSRQDADERLEELFDELLDEEEGGQDYAALFHEHLNKTQGTQVLDTGILGALPLTTMLSLQACGLAWYPPGSLHAYLTPQATRALSRSDLFRRSWNLRQEHLFALRRQVRQNTLLASWIVGLTALIEREMLNFCRQAPRLPEALESGPLAQDLTDQRERMPTEMMYSTRRDLIDYATFGQLQSLIFGGQLGAQFTLSQNRVNQVRHVRNLVTHLHSVRWPAVRIILRALSALQTL
jgi:hypothetical protein